MTQGAPAPTVNPPTREELIDLDSLLRDCYEKATRMPDGRLRRGRKNKHDTANRRWCDTIGFPAISMGKRASWSLINVITDIEEDLSPDYDFSVPPWLQMVDGVSFYAGKVAMISNAFLGVPLARSSAMWRIAGLSYEEAIKYHRLLGASAVILTCLHTLGYFVYSVQPTRTGSGLPSLYRRLFSQADGIRGLNPWCDGNECTAVSNLAGLIAWAAGLLLALASFTCVRRAPEPATFSSSRPTSSMVTQLSFWDVQQVSHSNTTSVYRGKLRCKTHEPFKCCSYMKLTYHTKKIALSFLFITKRGPAQAPQDGALPQPLADVLDVLQRCQASEMWKLKTHFCA